MTVSSELVRSLNGKAVEVVAPAGKPTLPGMFRVTETGAELPRVEVLFVRHGAAICQEIPRLLLPAIFVSRKGEGYVFWDASLSRHPFAKAAS